MRNVLYRAALIDPIAPDRLHCLPDAGLQVRDGRITAVGPIEQFQADSSSQIQELDGVLIPGFVDVHIHWVQHHVRGRFQADLLEWLQEHIWPEEAGFADPGFAREHAQRFFRDVVRAGTTQGMAYSSPHAEALHIAQEAALGDWVLGNVIMTARAPDELRAASLQTPEATESLLDALGPARYAITPRFALNCDVALMAGLGRLAGRRQARVQTHLAESTHEIAAIREAFPDAQDYTDVYDRAGLLTPRTVLGHCIHLSDNELARLGARGSWIAHCPSSNEALDSGRMDLDRIRAHGIPYALASDVGAGPSHSMLHVMQRFLTQHRTAGEHVTAGEALYRATLAGAQALGRGQEAGRLTPGRRADFVVLPHPGGSPDPEGWIAEWTAGEPATLEQRPLGTWVAGESIGDADAGID